MNSKAKGTVHWVKPTLPTNLQGLKFLDIPGTDQIFAGPDLTIVFPGPLDANKLKYALAQTLCDYPHAAGRLSYNKQTRKWSILLTNEGVPLTIGTTNLPYAHDEWFRNNERHPDLVDSLPMSFHPKEMGEEPLLRFKLVNWNSTGETSLSIAFCHILGDATTLLRIIHTASNYYLGVPRPLLPTFEKYTNPPPRIARQHVHEVLSRVSHLGVDYSTTKFYEMYQAMMATTSRVDFKLNLQEIEAIKQSANTCPGFKGQNISKMDAVLAYFVTVLNKTEDVPIQRIINVIEYRDVKAAPGINNWIPPPFTSAGNIIVTTHSQPIPLDPSRSYSIGSIASIVRQQIDETRSPSNLRCIVALSEELFERATETNRLFWWWPSEGAVGVNNMYKSAVRSHHFGYPESMRFYMYDAWERYLRIWPANPVKMLDGTWRPYDGGADICFRVRHEHRDKVVTFVRNDLKRMAGSESTSKL